jgi:hypothetical protein
VYNKNIGGKYIHSGHAIINVNSINSWTSPKLLNISNRYASNPDGGALYYNDNYLMVQYSGKSRLLSFRDVESCGLKVNRNGGIIDIFEHGSYHIFFQGHGICNFLFENAENCYSIEDLYETDDGDFNNIAICSYSDTISTTNYNSNNDMDVRSRPVIEILKSDILY